MVGGVVSVTWRRTSPEFFELVDADIVAALLNAAGVAFTRIHTARPGTVYVQIRAFSPRGRRRRQQAVLAALAEKEAREFWDLLSLSSVPLPRREVAYLRLGRLRFSLAARPPVLPFAGWISVSDVAWDWQDDRGRNWYEHIEDPAHPDQCPHGHLYPNRPGA